MKILVIGNGAREHSLIWKILQSDKVSKIYCASGNAGISKLAECVNIKNDDIDALLKFALKENIDLTIVGPEIPLVKGIVDKFNIHNLRIFGPNKRAALLEGSKIYAKKFITKYAIPTAKYKSFNNIHNALNSLHHFEFPLVIKADGLAAGKGAIICNNKINAEKTIISMMKDKIFGEAGENIIIEEFLNGTELSLLCFIGGKEIVIMESARDYKRVLDNDEGLNTGGMGCFSPNPIFTEELKEKIHNRILLKIEKGLKKEQLDFKGVLFIGLMIINNEPKVLEFNVRFGDPETEVILPRLESDLIDIFLKVLDGTLTNDDLKWSNKKSLCVIIASGGYPLEYEKGKVIKGLDELDKDIMIFHSGTKISSNEIVSNGGRVLAITALGDTIKEAKDKVYSNINKINFEKMYFRSDIGNL